jgi:hypothetical protein
VVLKEYYVKHPEVRNLFVDLLHVGDATHEDILREIISLSRDNHGEQISPVDVSKMSVIYQTLSSMIKSKDMGAEIRYAIPCLLYGLTKTPQRLF